jgi:CheY-like chemotaxis protein
MVVDDDDALRSSIIAVLDEAGYRVFAASTGQKAIDMLALEPDVIVLDMQLPDIHGAMVWRHIKNHAATSTTPVVVISGTRPTGIVPTVFLSKPFDGRQLLEAVRMAMEVP